MKLLTSAATGLIALAIATSAQAQAPAAASTANVSVSAKAKPAIAALQKAVNAGDTAQIPALLQAAQAAAQTNQDRWFIAQLQLKAAAAKSDTAGMTAALDAIAATGVSTPADLGNLYRGVGGTLYNAKQYAQAAALFDKALKANPNDSELQSLLAQSYLLGGQPAQALAASQRMIAAAGSAKPDENAYRIAVQAAFESKSPQLAEIAQQWLAAYPSPDAWRNNLVIYRGTANLDENGRLALLRLIDATGGLKNADDYNTYISGLLLLSNFNEAHAILDKAIAANVLTSSSTQAVAVNGKPTASAADLAAAAKTAQTGNALLRIGDRMYGSGDYAKAAETYRQAKAKGVDAPTADLYTGIALARAGDKAGARAALSSITGARAGIAKYWLLYLDQHP